MCIESTVGSPLIVNLVCECTESLLTTHTIKVCSDIVNIFRNLVETPIDTCSQFDRDVIVVVSPCILCVRTNVYTPCTHRNRGTPWIAISCPKEIFSADGDVIHRCC